MTVSRKGLRSVRVRGRATLQTRACDCALDVKEGAISTVITCEAVGCRSAIRATVQSPLEHKAAAILTESLSSET